MHAIKQQRTKKDRETDRHTVNYKSHLLDRVNIMDSVGHSVMTL